MELAEADPKGLVRESYNIEGITPGECRSIFLDWALSLISGQDVAVAAGSLIAHYAPINPDHPMTVVLNDALGATATAKRRGGRIGRMAG
jgi:hypothetical protein